MSDTVSAESRARILSRVTWRLIPLIFICYVIAYLDRVNVGFAAKTMQKDLGLTKEIFGWGGGLFFLGYFIFEIPSNLILQRVGARVWIARIMIVWGLVSMAMMFVVGKWSFYSMRVLLGLAEAGFFPGMILYLTYWIPARERARNGALFMMAAPIAMLIGGPVSGALLGLDGVAGLKGWQWLYLVEGFPAVALGVVTLFYLTDRPEDARWLAPEDREWLSQEMARERALQGPGVHASAFSSLRNPKVWLLCAFYFLNTTVTYGIFLWLPQMLGEASGYGDFKLGLLTAATLVPAILGMVLIGAHSDRTGERRWHTAACAVTAAVGLLLAVVSQKSVLFFALSFALCQLGQRSILAVFWSIPPAFLGGAAAAAGIALINSVGNLGGHFGSSMMGWLRDKTGGYAGGLMVLAAALVLESVLVLMIRLPAKREAGVEAKSA